MKIGDQVIYKTPEWNYLSVIIAISADGSNYMTGAVVTQVSP